MGKKGLGNVETARKQGDADFIVSPVRASSKVVLGLEEAQARPHRENMVVINCWVSCEMLAGLQKLVDAGHYITRSDAFRAAIHNLLEEEGIGW